MTRYSVARRMFPLSAAAIAIKPFERKRDEKKKTKQGSLISSNLVFFFCYWENKSRLLGPFCFERMINSHPSKRKINLLKKK